MISSQVDDVIVLFNGKNIVYESTVFTTLGQLTRAEFWREVLGITAIHRIWQTATQAA